MTENKSKYATNTDVKTYIRKLRIYPDLKMHGLHVASWDKQAE